MKTPRSIRGAVLGASVATFAILLALGASAPASADDTTTGWVRVGHFSADTKGVDVQITPVSGGASSTYALGDVTYGQVSKYLDMAVGTYAISMRAAGSAVSSKPVVSQSITVAPGTASTVAAYGLNAHLETAVFEDDLTAPVDGHARIRLLQVSAQHPNVTVATSTGVTIASNVASGSSTSYATVPAGPWTLMASGKGVNAQADFSLANGTINTLLVLDNASGGVTLSAVVDSSSVGSEPKGGVQTGGGWLASHPAALSRTVSRGVWGKAIAF